MSEHTCCGFMHGPGMCGEIPKLRARLKTIEAETIEWCAVVAEETNVETYGGWENPEDARSTLRSAAGAIRALASKEKDGR